MSLIQRNSKTSVYFGLKYLLAGEWSDDRSKAIEFQKALLEAGLEFAQVNTRPGGMNLTRTQPSPLQVALDSPGPAVMGMQLVCSQAQYNLEMFCTDAEAVAAAYQKTWKQEHYQILNSSATIHHLYSAATHAFAYLWENRLGQSGKDFAVFGGRPVAGGGLRLILPPHSQAGQDPVSIELRIESFMREPQKLLVQTIFTWIKPVVLGPGQSFEPSKLLETVENFAANEVWKFLVGTAESQ